MSGEAKTDAMFLRRIAAWLTYNEEDQEAEFKHRLHEIAMRIESGFYVKRAYEAGRHVGAGLERAAETQRPTVEPGSAERYAEQERKAALLPIKEVLALAAAFDAEAGAWHAPGWDGRRVANLLRALVALAETQRSLSQADDQMNKEGSPKRPSSEPQP